METNPFQSPKDLSAEVGWRTRIGIIGTDDLSDDQLFDEVLKGGRFVAFD